MSADPLSAPSLEVEPQPEPSALAAPDTAFLALLAWRAVVVCAALYSAVFKSFETLLMSLVVLGLALLFGEGWFRLHQASKERLRRELWERQARERRAAEARLRYEATLLQQTDADEGLMQLDLDMADAESAHPTSLSAASLSVHEFDRELQKEAFEDAVAQLRTA